MRKKILILLMLSFNVYAFDISPYEDFILGDKNNGKLYVYNKKERKIYETSALYGKEIGDELIGRRKITPSGEYIGVKMYSEHLGENITAFIKVSNSFVVAIHPVWTKSKYEKREQRLLSESASDNRISNGCINVSHDFYYDIIDKISNGIKVIILKENEIFNREAFERTIPQKDDFVVLSGE
jgi:hypothetical protein